MKRQHPATGTQPLPEIGPVAERCTILTCLASFSWLLLCLATSLLSQQMIANAGKSLAMRDTGSVRPMCRSGRESSRARDFSRVQPLWLRRDDLYDEAVLPLLLRIALECSQRRTHQEFQ
jgi:hypothetical protein